MSPLPATTSGKKRPLIQEEQLIYPCSFETAALSSGLARPLDHVPVLERNSWRKVKVVSKALFGKVYLASENLSDHHFRELPRHFAVKAMKRDLVLACRNSIECARNEIYASLALQSLACNGSPIPGTAEVYDVKQDDDYFYLATEFCRLGELLSVINDKGETQDENVLREVASQLLTTLSKLHHHGIAHRDVSLENVLVAEDGRVKLIDFGQAILVHAKGNASAEAPVKKTPRGMPGKAEYRAPEVAGLFGRPDYMATKLDVFALGVVLYILLTGEYLITPDASRTCFLDLEAGRFAGLTDRLRSRGLAGKVSQGFLDFLEQLLAPNPELRPSAKQALHHPWLAGVAAAEAPEPEHDDDDVASSSEGGQ